MSGTERGEDRGIEGDTLASGVLRHLRALAAEPRPTGSAAAERGRTYCAGVLASLGFRVEPRPFDYSAFPGAWGTPLGGLAGTAAVVGAASSGAAGHPGAALAVLVVAAPTIAAGGFWLARRGVLATPIMRRRGLSLEATRGDGRSTPELWLVAHVDSKSQPVPMLARAAGISLVVVAWLATLALALRATLAADAGTMSELWWLAAAAAVVGGLPVMASLVGGRSPGAVDNASGLATVLGAAALLPRAAPVGVLVTDAEELGMAGARAWCAARAAAGLPPATALNCDGVDDDGPITMMYSGARPRRLEAAFRRAASRAGEALRVVPLVPGVLVDGVALADAGWETITLSRGTLRTLRRVHTPADDLRRLRGTGIASAATVMADAAAMLLRESPGTPLP